MYYHCEQAKGMSRVNNYIMEVSEMKKITKLLVVSAILTMLFAVPVMAREVSFSSTNTDYLITLLEANNAKLDAGLAEFVKVQCGPNKDAIIANQTALVESAKAKVNKECAENHIGYLTKKYNLAVEYQGYRKAQLDWFTMLNTWSTTWSGKLAIAQAEYDAAVAITAADLAALESAKVKLACYL